MLGVGCGLKYTKLSIGLLITILFLGVTSMDVSGFLGFGGKEKWKEEVLLHDGRKIVVERLQTHGGRGEVGQSPIKEQSITFSLPGSSKVITWKDEYSEDVGHANFYLLALHILNNTPYIVTSPYACLAYNKWGRPNPPYVLFKFDGNVWKRIAISEFPLEFKSINLVITAGNEKELMRQGVVSAKQVQEQNSHGNMGVEFKTIIREPLKPGSAGVSCPELVRVKDGWVSPGGAKAPLPISSATSDSK